MPSALAVLRLITAANLVACSIGMSPGLVHSSPDGLDQPQPLHARKPTRGVAISILTKINSVMILIAQQAEKCQNGR
jgi:hypothetical protein